MKLAGSFETEPADESNPNQTNKGSHDAMAGAKGLALLNPMLEPCG